MYASDNHIAPSVGKQDSNNEQSTPPPSAMSSHHYQPQSQQQPYPHKSSYPGQSSSSGSTHNVRISVTTNEGSSNDSLTSLHDASTNSGGRDSIPQIRTNGSVDPYYQQQQQSIPQSQQGPYNPQGQARAYSNGNHQQPPSTLDMQQAPPPSQSHLPAYHIKHADNPALLSIVQSSHQTYSGRSPSSQCSMLIANLHSVHHKQHRTVLRRNVSHFA